MMEFRARDSMNNVHYFGLFNMLGLEPTDDTYFYTDATRARLICRTVERWTGLVDRNGKNIYEGDIVKTDFNLLGFLGGGADSAHVGVIEFSICEWVVKTGIVANSLAELRRNKWSLTVIGNTTDNKNLMETI